MRTATILSDTGEAGATDAPKPFVLHHGDCIEVMRDMADSSVDSIVTDPPYHLTSNARGSHSGEPGTPQARARIGDRGFMGKTWDGGDIAHSVEMWAECLRVLKPGGHLLAFSGSRTYHRMVCAIEDAGFEIRDQIMWLYGSGFPKSLNVSKAIDKDAGAERVVLAECSSDGSVRKPRETQPGGGERKSTYTPKITAPATDDARQWDGWGTALKPAHEPICVARKPTAKGLTVAANVLAHGTGAINIDGCRVGSESTARHTLKEMSSRGAQGDSYANQDHRYADRSSKYPTGSDAGRWPANVIHDGSAEVVALFPGQAGQAGALKTRNSDKTRNAFGAFAGTEDANFAPHDERGSAARFFYCAKASRADRNEGMDDPGPIHKHGVTLRQMENAVRDGVAKGNTHPTVKPTDLMAYLCRLVTPPGGLVLDPFMGSGSTGKACMREGFRFTGIDMTAEYITIAKARIEHEHQLATVAAALANVPSPQFDLFAEEAAC